MHSCSTTKIEKTKLADKYMIQYETANRSGNDSDALRNLLKAAKMKNSEAIARLGEAYIYGRNGLEINITKALELLTEASELGIMYLNGTGVDQDCNKAFHFFMKMAGA